MMDFLILRAFSNALFLSVLALYQIGAIFCTLSIAFGLLCCHVPLKKLTGFSLFHMLDSCVTWIFTKSSVPVYSWDYENEMANKDMKEGNVKEFYNVKDFDNADEAIKWLKD